MMANNKKQLIWAGVILFAVAAALIAFSLTRNVFDSGFDKILDKGIAETNAKCPMIIDSLTRLDCIIKTGPKTLRYNYTLAFYRDSVNLEEFQANMEKTILENVRKEPSMKFLRAAGTTFEYMYLDANGDFVIQVDITPDMYKK